MIVGWFFGHVLLLLAWNSCGVSAVVTLRRDGVQDELQNLNGQRPVVDQQPTRNLHYAGDMATLPSCCYLECPQAMRHNYGRAESNCAYNCNGCGINCCSCSQVSGDHHSAVEMQCTCTPGCDHHHHLAHHHHHGTWVPHHHHVSHYHHTH
jgi:hypothetical protein